MSVEVFLKSTQGINVAAIDVPLPHEHLLFRILWIGFTSLVFILSTVGNVIVAIVVLRYSHLRTVTNIYLVALANADFLHTLSLPFLMDMFIVGSWRFGDFLCKLYWIFSCVNWFAGVFLLVALSCDRYLAVCHPLQSRQWRTLTLAGVVVVATYAISLLSMVPVMLYAGAHNVGGKTICRILWPMNFTFNNGDVFFILYSFLLGFCVPLVCIFVFYGSVVWRLATTRKIGNTSCQRNRRVNTIVLAVILVYVVGWLPYWSNQLNLLRKMREEDSTTSFNGTATNDLHNKVVVSHYIVIGLVCQVFGAANCAANPVLYAFMTQNFRTAIKNLRCCTKTFSNSDQQNRASYLQGRKLPIENCQANLGGNEQLEKAHCTPHQTILQAILYRLLSCGCLITSQKLNFEVAQIGDIVLGIHMREDLLRLYYFNVFNSCLSFLNYVFVK